MFIGFGDSAAFAKVNPADAMMTNINKMINLNVGHSTNAWAAFDLLLKGNHKVDRIILISDMQCYNSYGGGHSVDSKWREYLVKVNPKAYLYSIDVNAYGTKTVPSTDGRAMSLFGWSDKLLDYMALSENKANMESEIVKW